MKSGEQTFVSLLGFVDNDRWLKLVWNKGPQESYSPGDTPHPYLPSIISRKPESIEYENRGQKAIEGAQGRLKALMAGPMGISAKKQTEPGRQWNECNNCRYVCSQETRICFNNLAPESGGLHVMERNPIASSAHARGGWTARTHTLEAQMNEVKEVN
jgi:hypothetical protein